MSDPRQTRAPEPRIVRRAVLLSRVRLFFQSFTWALLFRSFRSPVTTTTDLLIVQRAKQILNSEAVWNRADDRLYHSDAKTFSLYTALAKASREVSGKFEHRGGYMEEARFVIGEIAPQKHYDHPLMDFNNDPTTTLADIQRVLALTEIRIIKKLQNEK